MFDPAAVELYVSSNMRHSIELHGDSWLMSDLAEDVSWALNKVWEKTKWTPRPALVHKVGGTISLYRGQKFDASKIDLVEDGWKHDHCSICYWTLHFTEDPESGEGYRSRESDWVCSECYTKLIKNSFS